MNEVPDFVSLVRLVIPKDGLSLAGTKPNRVKSKIKKILVRAGHEVETLRGIGLRLGDYAIIYEVTETFIKASFQKYDLLTVNKPTAKRRSGSSKKIPPILTGVHPSMVGTTLEAFVDDTVRLLPDTWKASPANVYRWISTDMDFLYHTQHTAETAASYITGIGVSLLSHKPVINYSVIQIDDGYLLGIGPA